jgi:hypothetical protein
MQSEVEFSAEGGRNFAPMLDHMFKNCCDFGESNEAALGHCEDRIRDFRQEADRLAANKAAELSVDANRKGQVLGVYLRAHLPVSFSSNNPTVYSFTYLPVQTSYASHPDSHSDYLLKLDRR